MRFFLTFIAGIITGIILIQAKHAPSLSGAFLYVGCAVDSFFSEVRSSDNFFELDRLGENVNRLGKRIGGC